MAGPAGDARQPTGRRSLDETDAVPAVVTHTARDGRDYRTPGPWHQDGTVGNTEYTTFVGCDERARISGEATFRQGR